MSADEQLGPGKAFSGKSNINRKLREKKWEQVQVKAFTSWMNSMLEPKGLKIEKLETDLQDGLNLVSVLETASDKKVKGIDRKPVIPIQKINNLSIAIKFMQSVIGVRLDMISAEDIFGGNLKLILGMIFSLFRKVRDKMMAKLKLAGDGADSSSEAGLLKWIREMTDGYNGVNVQSFRESFNDGLAFGALVHKFDNGAIDYDSLDKSTPAKNLAAAFDAAEKHLGIPKLLDADDLLSGNVDERSVVLYTSLYFHAFVSNEERLKALEKENAMSKKFDSVHSELEEKSKSLAAAEEKLSEATANLEQSESLVSSLKEKTTKLESDNSELLERIKKLEEQISYLQKKGMTDSESMALMEQKISILGDLLEQEQGVTSEKEQQRHRLQSEMEELKRRMQEEKGLASHEKEEMSKKLQVLQEEQEKIRREREEASKKQAETSEEFDKYLDEAEQRKNNLLEEIQRLRDSVRSEMARRKQKAAEVEKLRKENAQLRQKVIVQSRARSGLACLRRNLEEHLEDMYKWRELHHGQVEENRFDLGKVVKDLKDNKSFSSQVNYLDEQLQRENRSLLRIVKLEDAKGRLQEKIEREGALRMKFRKEWRLRYFRLSGNKLSWFETETSAKREGTVDLNKNCDIVRQKAVKSEDSSSKLWPLKLTIQHEGQDKKLFIRAASKKERHSWYSLVSSKIASINYIRETEKTKNRPDTRVLTFLGQLDTTEVIVDHRPVHLESAQAVSKALPGHDKVETISFNEASLSSQSFRTLTDQIARAQQLKHLRLSSNNLSGEDVLYLSGKLESSGRLHSLSLDHNNISSAEATQIAKHLSAHAQLSSLHIHSNPLGDAGASALCKVIASAKWKIETLNLSSTQITDESVQAIALAVQENPNITKLNLSKNKISNQGAVALSKAFQDVLQLQSIDLSENDIGIEGAHALQRLLASNTNIDSICLSGNKKLSGGSALAKLTNKFYFPQLTFSRIVDGDSSSSSSSSSSASSSSSSSSSSTTSAPQKDDDSSSSNSSSSSDDDNNDNNEANTNDNDDDDNKSNDDDDKKDDNSSSSSSHSSSSKHSDSKHSSSSHSSSSSDSD